MPSNTLRAHPFWTKWSISWHVWPCPTKMVGYLLLFLEFLPCRKLKRSMAASWIYCWYVITLERKIFNFRHVWKQPIKNNMLLLFSWTVTSVPLIIMGHPIFLQNIHNLYMIQNTMFYLGCFKYHYTNKKDFKLL